MLTASLAALLALAPVGDYRTRFPLPSTTVPQGFGVCLNLRDANEREYDMMRELGVRWARMDLAWSRVEREKGVYDFSRYDPVVDALEKRGIRMMFILDYGNRLYEVDSPRTREGREAFANYARAAVRHYRGRGIVWEIWNEPNLRRFWRGEPSADEYTALVRVVGAAIREAAPDEWIAGMSTSRFDWKFLERCFEEGALAYLDAVTIHPYRDSRPPESVADDWARLRAMVDRYAEGREVELICGEWGYSNYSKGVSAERQADYAVRTYLANLASGVPMTLWYAWKDRPDLPNEKEKSFGLVTGQAKPKPAYSSLRAFLKALDGYSYDSRVDAGSSTDHAILFRRGSSQKLAAWTSGQGEALLDLPARMSGFGPAGGRGLGLKSGVQVLSQRR